MLSIVLLCFTFLSQEMAEYEVPDPEDILICPYNNAHAIRAKRMQHHLVKCRKVSN